MKRTRILVVIAVFLVAIPIFAGCEPRAATSPEAFRSAVRDIWATYCSLMKAGDVATWMNLWDADAAQNPPGAPMRLGKDAIQKAEKDFFKMFKFETFVIKIAGTYVDKEMGFAYGHYTFTLVPVAGGDTVNGDGKYETIFKRQADGTWKIWRDIFNSNVAPGM
jgi:ketosteroid isomerase-like protein